MVRAKDEIRLTDGVVMTLGAALDAGLLVLDKSDCWHGPRSRAPRTAYFATLIDGGGSFEIGKVLYMSRSGLSVDL
jgi:hypothetical protein